MPTKPKSPCRHPGCANLTYDIYCDSHKNINQRLSSSARGYNSRWQKRRKLYLQSHPLCVVCKRSGRLTPAMVVDHIKPHRGDEKLMWDEDNWQALCKCCHDKKTGHFDSRPIYKY